MPFSSVLLLLPLKRAEHSLYHSLDEHVSTYLSRNISHYLLPDTNTNIESTQLILSTLNYIRKQFMFTQDFEESNPGTVVNLDEKEKGGSLGKVKRKGSRGKAAEPEGGRKRFWDHEFWADFNFLEIAKAAQRCSAYLTSLLYVELWCEREFGQCQLPENVDSYNFESVAHLPSQSAPESKAKAANISLCQQLLLEIYSNINEPDGIYGLQRNHR